MKFALIKFPNAMLMNVKIVGERYILFLLLIHFNILLIEPIIAQNKSASNADSAHDDDLLESIDNKSWNALEHLKDGQLLVRLKSESKKIAALNKELDRAVICSAREKQLIQEIVKITNRRDSFNLAFIQAMRLNFKFCPVYFYYDKRHTELKKNHFFGSIFLDSLLHEVVENRIGNSNIVILKHDETPNQHLEAFLFVDTLGINYSSPFPKYQRVNTLSTWINSIDDPKSKYTQNANLYARKLNIKLFKVSRKLLRY